LSFPAFICSKDRGLNPEIDANNTDEIEEPSESAGETNLIIVAIEGYMYQGPEGDWG